MQLVNTSQKDSTRFHSNHIISLNLLSTESQRFIQQTLAHITISCAHFAVVLWQDLVLLLCWVNVGPVLKLHPREILLGKKIICDLYLEFLKFFIYHLKEEDFETGFSLQKISISYWKIRDCTDINDLEISLCQPVDTIKEKVNFSVWLYVDPSKSNKSVCVNFLMKMIYYACSEYWSIWAEPFPLSETRFRSYYFIFKLNDICICFVFI